MLRTETKAKEGTFRFPWHLSCLNFLFSSTKSPVPPTAYYQPSPFLRTLGIPSTIMTAFPCVHWLQWCLILFFFLYFLFLFFFEQSLWPLPSFLCETLRSKRYVNIWSFDLLAKNLWSKQTFDLTGQTNLKLLCCYHYFLALERATPKERACWVPMMPVEAQSTLKRSEEATNLRAFDFLFFFWIENTGQDAWDQMEKIATNSQRRTVL